MTSHHSFFASCPRGLEDLVLAELTLIKPTKVFKARGGVEFQSGKLQALDFLLNTRLASRLYMKMHYFRCKSIDDIFNKNVRYPWSTVMSNDQTIKVQTLFDREAKIKFGNSMMTSLKLKDAIVDGMREQTGERPSVNTESPTLSFLLRIEGNRGEDDFSATIWLDMSGDPLSHRGYRPEHATAPLRENLAAALVLSTDWKPESEHLIDPMCGSGTILIEAALIALNIPPSYLKIRKRLETRRTQYAFENHLWFTQDSNLTAGFEKLYTQLYQQTLEGLNKELPYPLKGSDNDARSLNLAMTSIKSARLTENQIHLEQCDAKDVLLPVEGGPGVILTNPPYGDRLGEVEELKEDYYQYGEYLKNHAQGYRAYILTSNPELRKAISLKTSKKIPFFNGDKDCRLLKYDLY